MHGDYLVVDGRRYDDIRYNFLVDGNYEGGIFYGKGPYEGSVAFRRDVDRMLRACNAEKAAIHYQKWAFNRLQIPIGIAFSWVILPAALTIKGSIAAPIHRKKMEEELDASFEALVVADREWQAWRVRERERELARELARRSRGSPSSFLDVLLDNPDLFDQAAKAVVAVGTVLYLVFSKDKLASAIRECAASAAVDAVVSAILSETDLSDLSALVDWLYTILVGTPQDAIATVVQDEVSSLLEANGLSVATAEGISSFGTCLASRLGD